MKYLWDISFFLPGVSVRPVEGCSLFNLDSYKSLDRRKENIQIDYSRE
jgi:hypothetical protein